MASRTEPDRPALVQLKPFLQPFPYGRDGQQSWAAQYALATPSLKAEVEKDGGIKDSQPYGEIWLGSTHQNGPCFVEGKNQSLKELIQLDPEYYLGPKLLADEQMSSQYKNNLPYLFKVLSFDKPLPLQCHPDKKLGAKLMEEEKRREGKNEDFVDTNAKPEVGIALSPFTAFVGFRPLDQLAAILRGTPELQELFKDETLETFYRVADNAAASDAEAKAALRTLFYDAVNASGAKVKSIVPKLRVRIAHMGADSVFGAANAFTAKGEANASGESEAEAMARAFEISVTTYGEEDVGTITALTLMNVLRMRAGEGAWIQGTSVLSGSGSLSLRSTNEGEHCSRRLARLRRGRHYRVHGQLGQHGRARTRHRRARRDLDLCRDADVSPPPRRPTPRLARRQVVERSTRSHAVVPRPDRRV